METGGFRALGSGSLGDTPEKPWKNLVAVVFTFLVVDVKASGTFHVCVCSSVLFTCLPQGILRPGGKDHLARLSAPGGWGSRLCREREG